MAVCVGFVSCFLSQMSNIKIHLLRNLLLQHHTEAKSVYLKSKWHPKCQLCLSRINSISKIGHSISTTYIKLLKKIVDAIILCGKQNIPLRGHRDDTTNKGNFLAILQYDEQLWSHLLKAYKNALYTSKTIQNEVIQLIGNHITGKMLKGLQGRGFYSIIGIWQVR